MIPKILHYVWLGGKEMPIEIKNCMDSWRKVMPDYEIKQWDESNIDEIDYDFVREAIAEKKWAFASDVIRLWVLYNYGGIYLDTDVRIFKPFDSLLENTVFTGRENSLHIIDQTTNNYVTTCCMGAKPHNAFIKRCLNYYDGRHFITSTNRSLPSELRLDMTLNSEVICRLAQDLGYNPSALQNHQQNCKDGLVIYPSSFFDPVGQKPESYTQHLALGSWREEAVTQWEYTLKYKIQWRLWSIVEKILRRFNRIIVKLN